MSSSIDPITPVAATLSDAELRERSRAVGVLLDLAAIADGADPLSGYRDLLRELLSRVETHFGAPAAMTLIVQELVLGLNDKAQVNHLIEQLHIVAGDDSVGTGSAGSD